MDQFSWDLSVLYKSDDDPQIGKDLATVTREAEKFALKWRERTDYLSDPKVLRQALDEIEQRAKNYGSDGKPGYYIGLRLAQDQNNSKLRALETKISDVAKTNITTTQFFSLNLAKISPATQAKFLAAKELLPYRHLLERIFVQAKHNLSEKEERIMLLLGDPAHGKWVQMLSGLLAKEQRPVADDSGTTSPKTLDELLALLASSNKAIRDAAAQAINDIIGGYTDIAENEFNAILETDKVDDQLRGYDRPDAGRHLSDDIDSTVVDSLVAAVAGQFPISQRFYTLKAKLLGLPKLAYHERGVEFGEIGGAYPYERAVELVSRALTGLDAEFGKIFQMFVDQRQIDVFPQPGKVGGAFCAADMVTLPTYILLNHTDKFRDVTTLAHEVGHGINDELVKAAQPAIYAGTSLATAEVASTFMEDFVLAELLQEANDEQRLAILMMKLNDDVSTIFRQVAAYQFEQAVHAAYRREGYLSHEQIGQLFREHMAAYMGPAVEQSSGSQNWWIYWSHFRASFYVYSYASGLLISKSLQAGVKKDRGFITKVKKFLSAGVSESPAAIFQELGINVTDAAFWQQGLGEVAALLEETEKLAKKLGKV